MSTLWNKIKMETILERHIRYCPRRFLLWSHMNSHESRDILDSHWWYNIQQHHKPHLFPCTILNIEVNIDIAGKIRNETQLIWAGVPGMKRAKRDTNQKGNKVKQTGKHKDIFHVFIQWIYFWLFWGDRWQVSHIRTHPLFYGTPSPSQKILFG